jgi:hypothetical protein
MIQILFSNALAFIACSSRLGLGTCYLGFFLDTFVEPYTLWSVIRQPIIGSLGVMILRGGFLMLGIGSNLLILFAISLEPLWGLSFDFRHVELVPLEIVVETFSVVA